jgi:uncharacterized protein YodC (DUF2158 family)
VTTPSVNIGDVVELKSGGPQMAVEFYDDRDPSRVICCWFDSDGNRKEGNFSMASLRPSNASSSGASSTSQNP